MPKGKILVVDDERPILHLMQAILHEGGYQTLTAGSVVAAREVFDKESDIDLLLTDLNMPDGSGVDLIKYICEQNPQVGVVVASIIENPIEVEEVLEAGIYGYIVKPFSKNTVLITVANALRRRELESKARESLDDLESRLHLIINNLHVGLILMDASMQIVAVNNQVMGWFSDASIGHSISLLDNYYLSSEQKIRCGQLANQVIETGLAGSILGRFRTQQGELDLHLFMVCVCALSSNENYVIITIEDKTEHLLMEGELRQSQKLEAIGQLAAGIAHEINTPIQYVGDNIRFFSEAFADMNGLLSNYENLLHQHAGEAGEVREKVAGLREEADMDFLEEEIPLTIEQSTEGIKRVGSIIRALREFSHPGGVEKNLTDINHCLESTATVCRNEWKYVAELKLDLAADLPSVFCLPGEINQVLLNLIVNAAHAIGEQVEQGRFAKGVINISTRRIGGSVQISIRDNGGGIPESIRYRIFDPFFTTKELGKGTGQGLAIARNIVVDKHGGSLNVESVHGKGTTFHIMLPVD